MIRFIPLSTTLSFRGVDSSRLVALVSKSQYYCSSLVLRVKVIDKLMNILGIESSCDETAAGVVRNGNELLSNVISSQVDIHSRFGGIVPELASRQHVLQIDSVIGHALDEAKVDLESVSAIAVTEGPGLAGALMVGLNTGKSLAWARDIPLIGINHLEGHIYAAWLEYEDPAEKPGFPLMCLIASGGHTELILMTGHGHYTAVGRTRDDAAGEAFDKGARLLGLGFPGGPAIQNTAQGATEAEKFPRAWLGDTFDFSFSGLKTSLLHRTQKLSDDSFDETGRMKKSVVASQAAAYQESIADVLSEKAIRAAKKYKAKGILIGGGVAANSRLRELIDQRSPIPTLIPKNSLCTDNGAMIAAAALYHLENGERSSFDIDVNPNMSLA